MRLLSFRASNRSRFGLLRDDAIVDLSAAFGNKATSLGEMLAAGPSPATFAAANSAPADYFLREVEILPPIPKPGKIICIGVNYGKRNAEYRDAGDAPKFPSVFIRTPESLVGHGQPIMRPPESAQLDYEGEIVLVIGKHGRRISRHMALEHVAGLSLMNEGSVRDWLRHAKFNVTQGKNFERSGSWGPWIVTADELAPAAALHLTTTVNGELRQDDTTDNLIFAFDYLISYLSAFMPLNPGDIIATGTPTGAGARLDPPQYLADGDTVRVSVAGIGELENTVEDEAVAAANFLPDR